MNDDLHVLLSGSDGETVAAGKRAAILDASTGVLRRGAIVRRAAIATVVAGVFLAGGTAGWLMKPAVVERQYVQAEPPAPPPLPAPPSVSPPLSPRDLEIQAELADDRPQAARWYREAGDQYLTAARDYEQAARCYRLHLNAAAPDEQVATPSDSWLLLSMKSNRIPQE